MTELRFSVVIPTYQRKDLAVAAVRALEAQEGAPPFEVVVVVDGSTDGTAPALRELATSFPFDVVEQRNGGRAAAANHGASIARGELVLFLDDDMEAHPDLLATHDGAHRTGADVVFGHIPLHPASPPTFLAAGVGAWAEQRRVRILERGQLELADLVTGQMSLRRELFLRIGRFNAEFTRGGTFGGEDLDLGQRLVEGGYKIVFQPDAISWQRYVVTPRQYLRQWRQWGRASVLLARAHPDESDQIFQLRETRFDRFVGRRIRWPLRIVVLVLARVRPRSARVGRWFKRVRDLEYFRGVREAGSRPVPGQPTQVTRFERAGS